MYLTQNAPNVTQCIVSCDHHVFIFSGKELQPTESSSSEHSHRLEHPWTPGWSAWLIPGEDPARQISEWSKKVCQTKRAPQKPAVRRMTTNLEHHFHFFSESFWWLIEPHPLLVVHPKSFGWWRSRNADPVYLNWSIPVYPAGGDNPRPQMMAKYHETQTAGGWCKWHCFTHINF